MSAAPMKTAPSAQQPPEERFWVKYSPNHEAPVSGVSSIVLHLAGLGFLFLFGYYLVHSSTANDPLSVAAIQIEGGGGGDPDGVGDKKGTEKPQDISHGNPDVKPSKGPDTPVDQPEPITVAKIDPIDFVPKDDHGRAVSASTEAIKGLEKLDKKVREDLFNSVKPHGKGGSGSGGGKGNGKGPGEGDSEGPGSGKVSARQKRIMRWTLVFETRTGEDYRQQLKYFGAIIATPTREQGKFIVYRSLTKGETGKVDDLKEMNRIFWVDSRPDSVATLAMAMGIRPYPKEFIAFFPVEVEEKMLKLEQDFHRKREEDIVETRFVVKQRGRDYIIEVDGGR